jgi:hypothetical protein
MAGAGWKRVVTLLPINDSRQIAAADKVHEWVQSRVPGHTRSLIRPSLFEGFWYDEDEDVVWRDSISILFVDTDLPPDRLYRFLQEMYIEVDTRYIEESSGQDLIWITVSDLQVPFPRGT